MQKETVYKARIRILRKPHILSRYHKKVLDSTIYFLVEDSWDEKEVHDRLMKKEKEIKEEFLKRYQPDYGPFKIVGINFKGEKEEVYLEALDERALFDLRNNHS